MKTMLIVSLTIQLFAVSAHASDECNSLLSDGFHFLVQDLAKLRYDLDSKIAAGDSNILTRGFETAFTQKRTELLKRELSLTEVKLDSKLREEISKIQGHEETDKTSITQQKQAQATASARADIGVSVIGHLKLVRRGHEVSTLSDDTVLVFGGRSPTGELIPEVEIYYPKEDRFETFGKLKQPRKDFSHLVLSDGKILLWGGKADVFLDSAELIDPVAKTITLVDQFKFRGTGLFYRVSDSEFLQYQTLDSWGVYHFEQHTFKEVRGLTANSIVSFDPGRNDIIFSEKEKFKRISLSKAGVTEIGDVKLIRDDGYAQVSLLDGQILLSGGQSTDRGNATIHSLIERFNPITGISEEIGNLLVPRHQHSMKVLPDGRVIVLGGFNDSGLVTVVEMIDPSSGESIILGSTRGFDEVPRTAILSNGDVIVVGPQGTDLIERIKVGLR